ncbi:MAG: homoserine kinase [Candidatus Symbiobacter sp.]|nr:homoserine kinase [Candidatus Symbiobacter sp.]
MAVYTRIGEDELKQFLAAYSVGELVECHPIAEGVENSNYRLLLRAPSGGRVPYILTLYEKRVNPKQLPFFIGLMEHLAAAGVQCPVPIKARDGEALRHLAGRSAAMVSFLPGHSINPKLTAFSPDHLRQLGAAVARMHLAGAGFALQRPNDLSVAGWQHLAAETVGRAGGIADHLDTTIADELRYLTQNWPCDVPHGLPLGVIHADLFPDNVFFREGKYSGMIDFYFACNDFLAYELAVLLNSWCFDFPAVTYNVNNAKALLAGYQTIRPLAPAEQDNLIILARGAALRFLLTRLYDWLHHPPDALVERKDPREYLIKLQFFQSARPEQILA